MAPQDMSKTEQPQQPMVSKPPVRPGRLLGKVGLIVGTVMLCFGGSFLGAWVLLSTGIVKPDASRTITDNSQKIVMQQGEVIADVFKKVSPSTVAITTHTTVTSRSSVFDDEGFDGEAAGSGIIVSKDGYVMTNKHVVPEGTGSVSVITADGKEYKDVKVVGQDPTNDIAFLKINGVSNLTPAQIGDSDQVEPGQQVVAIGNALGVFRNSVASGIISGTGRPLTASDESGEFTEQLEDMFQTDAAINPGNSGGPLVNLKGEVIGMNTAVTQDAQGIGFAIPINTAKAEIKSVTTSGKISKAYIGVRYVSVTPDIATDLKLTVTEGALLATGDDHAAIIAGSPADKAGLKTNDVVIKVNDTPVVAGKGLATILSQFAPGDTVKLTIVRDGKQQVVSVTLGEYQLGS